MLYDNNKNLISINHVTLLFNLLYQPDDVLGAFVSLSSHRLLILFLRLKNPFALNLEADKEQHKIHGNFEPLRRDAGHKKRKPVNSHKGSQHL